MTTTDEYERDFLNPSAGLKRTGRLDFKLLQNEDDVGDGYPGLQKAMRNWVKYWLHDGVLDQDIDLNDQSLVDVNSIDGGGDAITVNDDLNMGNHNIDDVASINGGGNAVVFNDDLDIGEDEVDGNRTLTIWAENSYEADLNFKEGAPHGMGIRYNSDDNILYVDQYDNNTTPSPLAKFYRQSDKIDLLGDLDMGGNDIDDVASINGGGNAVVFNDNIDLDGTLNVQNAVTLQSTLDVSGNVDLEGNIDVNGTANLDEVDIDNANPVNIATVNNAGTDTDQFLVLDGSGNVDLRSASELLADLSGDADSSFDMNSQDLTNVANIKVQDDIQHYGDTNNLISFTGDTQTFQTDGSTRLIIDNNGLDTNGNDIDINTGNLVVNDGSDRTLTPTELAILNGASVTTAELNYLDGASSNLTNITDSEFTQLENIGAVTISNDQWGYVGSMSAQPMEDLVDDSTPQLGGDLDTNGYSINDDSGNNEISINDNLNVSGSITLTGNVDGVDISSFKSSFDDHDGGYVEDHHNFTDISFSPYGQHQYSDEFDNVSGDGVIVESRIYDQDTGTHPVDWEVGDYVILSWKNPMHFSDWRVYCDSDDNYSGDTFKIYAELNGSWVQVDSEGDEGIGNGTWSIWSAFYFPFMTRKIKIECTGLSGNELRINEIEFRG